MQGGHWGHAQCRAELPPLQGGGFELHPNAYSSAGAPSSSFSPNAASLGKSMLLKCQCVQFRHGHLSQKFRKTPPNWQQTPRHPQWRAPSQELVYSAPGKLASKTFYCCRLFAHPSCQYAYGITLIAAMRWAAPPSLQDAPHLSLRSQYPCGGMSHSVRRCIQPSGVSSGIPLFPVSLHPLPDALPDHQGDSAHRPAACWMFLLLSPYSV